MRCLVIGANFTNHGAESMIDVTIDQISRRWPGIEIVVASYAKSENKAYGSHLIEGTDGPVGFEFIANSRRLLRVPRTIFASFAPKVLRTGILKGDPYLATFDAVDFVVDISGFALSDQRSAVRRLAYGIEGLSASALGKPIYLLTQAFGPFKSVLSRVIARFVLPRAGLVVARDQESVDHIEKLQLREHIVLRQCADMALLLPSSTPVSDAATTGGPLLGIVPNVNLLTNTERNGKPGEYVSSLAAIASKGLELGADVKFICYESFPDRQVDDVWVARSAIRMLEPLEIELVSDASALELKSIVAGLDLLVGARYHSLVAALATATPFLAVGWAHKYAELAADAGVPGAFLDGRRASLDQLLAGVEASWSRRIETREELAKAVPRLFASALEAFDLLELEVRKSQRALR